VGKIIKLLISIAKREEIRSRMEKERFATITKSKRYAGTGATNKNPKTDTNKTTVKFDNLTARSRILEKPLFILMSF
ncbi:MAG: hypothetical protein NZO16_07075, partial [Deltaproteobacteria bacterium]|nr:hypothetical protein [Deltaproteobacteria bacterium]